MKSSTKDQAEGKFHKVRGKLRQIAEELSDRDKVHLEYKDSVELAADVSNIRERKTQKNEVMAIAFIAR